MASKIDALEKEIQNDQADINEATDAIAADERSLGSVEQQLAESNEQVTNLKTELARNEALRDQIVERDQSIEIELVNLSKQSEADKEQAEKIRSELSRISEELRVLNATHAELGAQRQQLQENLDVVRSQWRDVREKKHKIALELENFRTTVQSLQEQLSRNTQQQEELRLRCAEIQTAREAQDTPQIDLKETLEQALSVRLGLEGHLAEARKKLEALEADSRTDDEARLLAEQKVEERKQVLEQARLEERTVQVKLQELNERIAETDYGLDALLAELPQELTEEGAQEALDKTRVKISRLGAINLAAIDEFSQLSERKEYLDKQNEDLIQALDTLECGIRKIDK